MKPIEVGREGKECYFDSTSALPTLSREGNQMKGTPPLHLALAVGGSRLD